VYIGQRYHLPSDTYTEERCIRYCWLRPLTSSVRRQVLKQIQQKGHGVDEDGAEPQFP